MTICVLKALNKYTSLKRRKVIGNQASFIYEHFQKTKTVYECFWGSDALTIKDRCLRTWHNTLHKEPIH